MYIHLGEVRTLKRSTRIKRAEIRMRRANVLRYHSLGYTATKIAELLHVSDALIHLDIEALKTENRKNGADWLQQNVMYEYMRALSTLDYLISEHYRVVETSQDVRERIASRTGLRECVVNKMDLIGRYEVTPSNTQQEESSTTNEETLGDPTEELVVQTTQEEPTSDTGTTSEEGG